MQPYEKYSFWKERRSEAEIAALPPEAADYAARYGKLSDYPDLCYNVTQNGIYAGAYNNQLDTLVAKNNPPIGTARFWEPRIADDVLERHKTRRLFIYLVAIGAPFTHRAAKHAARRGDIRFLRLIHNVKGPIEKNALFAAVRKGRDACVAFLFDILPLTQDDHRDLLEMAARKGQSNTFEYLLERVGTRQIGRDVMWAAARGGTARIIDLITMSNVAPWTYREVLIANQCNTFRALQRLVSYTMHLYEGSAGAGDRVELQSRVRIWCGLKRVRFVHEVMGISFDRYTQGPQIRPGKPATRCYYYIRHHMPQLRAVEDVSAQKPWHRSQCDCPCPPVGSAEERQIIESYERLKREPPIVRISSGLGGMFIC